MSNFWAKAKAWAMQGSTISGLTTVAVTAAAAATGAMTWPIAVPALVGATVLMVMPQVSATARTPVEKLILDTAAAIGSGGLKGLAASAPILGGDALSAVQAINPSAAAMVIPAVGDAIGKAAGSAAGAAIQHVLNAGGTVEAAGVAASHAAPAAASAVAAIATTLATDALSGKPMQQTETDVASDVEGAVKSAL